MSVKISGFSFIRNGVLFDFPFRESIRSALDLVDEFVIAVGQNDDNTLDELRLIKNPKLKLIESPWNLTNQKGGLELANQTNIALEHCQNDLCLYLQGDEVLHQDDHPQILQDADTLAKDPNLDMLIFNWLHFYGNYKTILNSPKRYRREGRIIKKSSGLKSFQDAQGFRIWHPESGRWTKGKGLLAKARVFHYGWVRSAARMSKKNEIFNRLWHGHARDGTYVETHAFPLEFGMEVYHDSHPKYMSERIKNAKNLTQFSTLANSIWDSPSLWLRKKIEHLCGWRMGEFKNYRL